MLLIAKLSQTWTIKFSSLCTIAQNMSFLSSKTNLKLKKNLNIYKAFLYDLFPNLYEDLFCWWMIQNCKYQICSLAQYKKKTNFHQLTKTHKISYLKNKHWTLYFDQHNWLFLENKLNIFLVTFEFFFLYF